MRKREDILIVIQKISKIQNLLILSSIEYLSILAKDDLEYIKNKILELESDNFLLRKELSAANKGAKSNALVANRFAEIAHNLIIKGEKHGTQQRFRRIKEYIIEYSRFIFKRFR